MNSNTNTKAEGSKRKCTKGPVPTPAGEKESGINTTLPFIEPTKDPDADKETVSIKMNIDYTSSKDDKINYKTKSFKVIENFGYNRAAVVKTLCDVYLEIFTAYALLMPTKKLSASK